jgi:invasion protein IalB
MSQTSSEQSFPRPAHHTVAMVLGGLGLFVLGAVVGTVSLHFWMAGHDFRHTVATAEYIQDWQLNCPPAKQTADACSVRQIILQQGTNSPLAQIEVDRGVNADIIKFVVPLGVLVGPGLAFSTDGTGPVAVAYTTCDLSGCIAIAPLTATQLGQMEHGTGGRVIVLARNGKGAAIPYSLKGFADAMRERDSDWRNRAGHWF